MSPTVVPAVLGVSGFGTRKSGDKIFPSVTSLDVAQQFLDVAVEFGCNKIDTARIYGSGESEHFVGKIDLRGCRVNTKISPRNGGLRPGKLEAQLEVSRSALNGVPIRVLYWHHIDREVTSWEESLQIMDKLHKQGVFEEFGLSNAYSWEVSEIVAICRERGWVRPTVYQGIYNALDRVAEEELFPCLRKHGIRFAAYSPLAGGLLTGFHLNDPDLLNRNIRFSPDSPLSNFYNPRYVHSRPVLLRVRALAEKHGLTLTEVSVRWIVYHSVMRPNDFGIIYGGHVPEQLRAAISCHNKGPLPEDIVKELEDSWQNDLRGKVPTYVP